MADYEVMVQNVECNEEAAAISGLVNGRQVTVVVRLSRRPKTGGQPALGKWYANALVDAYLAAAPPTPSAAAIKVSR